MLHKMDRIILTSALVLSLAASAQAQNPPNLVANGGFENPHLAAPQEYQTFPGGLPGPPGWNVVDLSGFENEGVDIVSINNGPQYARTGDQSLDMAGTPGPGRIRQSIPTIPGQTYELSFYTSSNIFQESVTVMWEGNNLGTFSTPPGSWQERTFSVTATQTRSRLEFIAVHDAVHPNEGALIDDVSLVATCPFVIPVANGNFERPQIQQVVPACMGSGLLPNWRVVAPSPAQGVDHVPAPSGGSQSVDLSGTIGPGTLQQTIPTRPGRTYRVSFKRSAKANSQTEVMTAKFGIVPVKVTGTAGNWRDFAFNGPSSLFGGNTTLLQLIGGTQGSVLVDSVEVKELCP